VFETSDYKFHETKINKNTTPCQAQNAIHPAKRGVKRVEIELAMLDFRPGHCQLIARACFPHSRPDSPFRFALAATELTEALALVSMYGTDIYLGYENLFGSPGVGPGPCSSQVGGGGNKPVATRATGEMLIRYSMDLFY